MGLQMSDAEPEAATWLRNALLVLRADRVIAISAQIRRALERLPFARGKLTELDLVGVDASRFRGIDGEAARTRLGLAASDLVVSTIGALHPRKSHELFVAAMAHVQRELPAVVALIVGEGTERARLERQIVRAGLAGTVRLVGARRDIPAVLAATDVYVKPGVVEGFVGITVLEAMAARRPVVAFDTVDVRAAIRDGETGVIVPSRDVGALAAAVIHLLTHTNDAHALSARAETAVLERFSLDAIARRLHDAYAEFVRWKAARCAE